MDSLAFLTRQYGLLILFLIFADMFPAVMLARYVRLRGSRQVGEAMGDRNSHLSFYRRCALLAARALKDYEKREKKASVYVKAVEKMKKAGYTSEYSAAIYLFLKYGLATMLFILAFSVNYPNFIGPAAVYAAVRAVIEIVVAGGRRRVNLKFQKYIYKIYKYLYNQISSGVKVTDAIRTVYDVIEDTELKKVLVRMAAVYELTLDIDAALVEFRSNFAVHEAETLCVALKQGIETGDNQDLLARQEDIMFKKYFNYIQAETDSCRNRSVAAAAVFIAIVVIMIIVPMLNDVSAAVGRIFVS